VIRKQEQSTGRGWSFASAIKSVRLLPWCLLAAFALGAVTAVSASALSYSVAAWGENEFGQLGDGTFTGPEKCGINACSSTAVAVGGITNAAGAASGGVFACALLSGASIECWGEAEHGELGDGTTTGPEECGVRACSLKPVPVSGIANATEVDAGLRHACALLPGGGIDCWGEGGGGQLGNGTTTTSPIPVAVSGISSAIHVSAGHSDSCALLLGGQVDCWGEGEHGQLGNGETINSSIPVAVSGITNAIGVSSGGEVTCAVLATGSVDCWGSNTHGQLGNGTTTDSSTPVAVSGITNATEVSASGGSACALLSSGGVDCWGQNSVGQLGNGTTANSSTPVAVSGLINATTLAAGSHACALLSSGGIDCWGYNGRGALGNGTHLGPQICPGAPPFEGEYPCSKAPVAVSGLTGAAGVSIESESTVAYGVGQVPEPKPEELYGPENQAEPNQVRACAGKPVSCATGNEVVSQTDLSVGGRGVPLSVARTYNAQAAVSEASPGPFGYGWSASFTDHLNINAEAGTATVVQANGSAVVFKGTIGAPGELTAPAWAQAKLVLNGDGTYTYTLPSQQTSHFDSSGRLLSEVDRNGNTTTLSRNGEGRLESVTDAAGRKLAFAYDSEGQVESVKDPLGNTVRYTYEGGNLASVTEPGEVSPRWQLKYDPSHRLTTLTDGRGGTTTNEYDAANRVISQKDPAERVLTFEYGSHRTTITNQSTHAVTNELFTAGNEPESITHGWSTASASTETFTYDGVGDLTGVTDGNGHTTKYGYDAAGNRTSMLDADKHETKWTYNSTRDVISTRTPKGETTTIKRDSHGNAEAIERPAPESKTQVTKYKYDTVGELEAATDPLERTTKFEYDTRGDRTAEIDPEGDKRTWSYDEDSSVSSSVSPRGNVEGAEAAKYTTKVERDAQGRATLVTDPLGHKTKYAYDANGNLESQTDPNGHKTNYTYDADNEPTKVEEPNGTITETGYDGAGQVVSQTDGNKHTTKYTRNVLEQVTEVVDPLLRKTTKEYDKAGNLTKLTDPAKRVSTKVYDAANLLKETTYSDGKTHSVQYEYDSDGDRTKMIDATGTTTDTYDQLDRLSEAQDGHGSIVKYEYDLANEQKKITYPNGKAVVRTFDKAGRLQKVTDWLEHTTTFAYNADSFQTSATFPAGTGDEDVYTYDEADQLSEVRMSKGAESLASLAYVRDADGQVKAITSKGLPGEEKPAYEYDSNNRLTKGATTAYEYDAADNPTKTGASTNTYDNANELKTGTSVSYSYDELGERTKRTPTSGAAMTYGYNQAGELTLVERAKAGKVAGFTDTYAYNGEGLRSSQTLSGTTTFLAWDTTEALPLILNDGTNSYVYGPGGLPVEQINNTTGTVLYLHHDQQGSTRLLTGSTGKAEATFTYDAYGNQTGHTGTATTPLGWDAQYTSSDTGLIYLRNRVYDPSTMQFLTVDPLEMVTRAPYTYGEDNPLNGSDATGLSSWNPFSESFWTEGNVISESPLNPIPYYEQEIESYENGCGYLASVAHGLEGAVVGALDVSGAGEEAAGAEAAAGAGEGAGAKGWGTFLNELVEATGHHYFFIGTSIVATGVGAGFLVYEGGKLVYEAVR
jgi:RHS repeat-associated protein